jgi:hypothetical protein
MGARRGLWIALALGVPGCGALFAQGGAGSTSVANPLIGKPAKLATGTTDRYLQSSSATDCNRWPVRDTWEVSADQSEVCVTYQRMLSFLPGEIPPATPETVALATEKKGTVTVSLVTSGEPERHGFCNIAGEVRTVWKQSFRGCTANDALLTISSHELLVSRAGHTAAAWRFDGAEGGRSAPQEAARLSSSSE